MINNYLKSRKFRYSKFASVVRSAIKMWDYVDAEKNFQLGMSFLDLNEVEGDYAEFGVGESLIISHYFSRTNNIKNMNFFGFDSFSGLPKPEETDIHKSWNEGDYKNPIEDFKKKLKNVDISENKVKLVEGWFKDTLRKDKDYGIKKLAFVHIDCDFYSSTKLVLDFIKPYLQNGTIILFDDYNTFKGNYRNGEKRAFEEFKEKNKDIEFYEIPAWTFRKIFYCVRKVKDRSKNG